MVIDTCIFIEHLRAKDKTTTALFKLPAGGDKYLSAVTLFELYVGAPTIERQQDIKQ